MTSIKVKDVAFGKKDGEILCLKLGLVVCGLSSHSDLHNNKGHKSVSVRKICPSLPPVSWWLLVRQLYFTTTSKDDPT